MASKLKSKISILNFLKKHKKLAILLVFIIILFSLYKSDKIMIESPQKIAQYISEKTNIDFFPLWSRVTGYIFRFEDNVNPFRIKKNLLGGELPIYSLELSSNDLVHFDNISKYSVKLGYMPAELNEWRKAKLEVDSKKYEVKARFHGDRPPHWANELKSYQIKTEKEEYINNMGRFNLIIFEDRLLRAAAARLVSNKLALTDIRDDVITLKINGVVQGVYYLQESLDNNFLENNECPNCYIIKTSDNWVEDHGYNADPYAISNNGLVRVGHITPFDQEISNLGISEDISNRTRIISRINEFYEAIKNNNPNIIDYFDLDQLSSFEAFRMLTGGLHLVAGDNLRMVYMATNSKFYPVPYSELFLKLDIEKGGLEHSLNFFGKYIPLFYLLDKNDELRHLRNKKVYDFILNNGLLEEYDRIVQKYYPFIVSYKTNAYSSRVLRYKLKETRDILEHNMKIVKSNLEYSKFYANIFENENKIKIEILPDSIAELKFKSFKISLDEPYAGEVLLSYINSQNKSEARLAGIKEKTSVIDLTEYLSGLYFSAGLDENLYPALKKYTIELTFKDADEISLKGAYIKMINDITGKDIGDNDAYIQIADENDYYKNSKYTSISKLMKNFPELKFVYKNGELTLSEGDYALNKDLVIPKIKNFIIDAGTVIRIAEGKAILSYSPVTIAGTKEKPVKITSLDNNKPFGAFAVVGDGNQNDLVSINWLDLSNGYEKWINGAYFSGQLSIYHIPTVLINNTQVHDSHSDDGINIKYADVYIENSKFYNNYADQIDFDFVSGIVKDSEFKGPAVGDANGDGLDVSGSYLLVKNSKFIGLHDKGASVGEKSTVVAYKNQYFDGNSGIASKDKSVVYSFENLLKNNNVAISAYQKKPMFGGGVLYEYKDSLISNKKDYEEDAQSQIIKLDLSSEQYGQYKASIDKDIIPFPKNIIMFPITKNAIVSANYRYSPPKTK